MGMGYMQLHSSLLKRGLVVEGLCSVVTILKFLTPLCFVNEVHWDNGA